MPRILFLLVIKEKFLHLFISTHLIFTPWPLLLASCTNSSLFLSENYDDARWCPFEISQSTFHPLFFNLSEVRDYGCLSVYEDQGDEEYNPI